MRFVVIISLLIVGLAALGCSDKKAMIPDGDTDSNTDDGLGPGEDCTGDLECAEPYVCNSVGVCAEPGGEGTSPEDGPCMTNDNCQWGLVCASDGTCQEPGDPGTTPDGGDCEESEDCQMFLECIDGTCQGFQPPYWGGGTCAETDSYPDEFEVFFEVDGASGEFYRLPFPNDIRFKDGHIDLTGHANPGVLIESLGNPVDDYFDMIQSDLDGFGTNSCSYFRMTKWIDGDTLQNSEDLYIINITPTSPDYGEKAYTSYRGNNHRNNYMCYNWLATCPTPGRDLDPLTTYAAIITTGIKSADGDDLQPSENFTAMLQSAPPSDDALADAWDVYQPLRDFIDDQGVDASTIAGASVFTTGSIWTPLPRVREAVRAAELPAVTELAEDTSSADFTMYTGRVSIPAYQNGTRPYREVGDGGFVVYDSAGLPIEVFEEQVEFVLTVPLGTAPVDGWPVILYAHGTGGGEMSFVDNGVAALMAEVGAAVIGIEQVMHGERRGVPEGDGDLDENYPGRLFYNFLNPRAARDNNIQAAADYFQLTRLVENWDTITGEALLFDPEKIYFYGHSQGSQGPFIAAAHELDIKLIIISGAGGYLIDSFLGKHNPVDIAAGMSVVLMEFEVERYHPLLNLIQAGFDVVDPLNHAAAVFRAEWPDDTYTKKHVFLSYGIDDTFTPEDCQVALAKGLSVAQWGIEGHEIPSVPEIESLPHSETYSYGTGPVTAVVVQYEPDGYDGHYVMFQNPDAITQQQAFIETAITDGVPVLIGP